MTGDRRVGLALWVAGVLAVLSLLAAPLEALQPAGMTFDWWQFRLLALINPLVIVTIAVAAGGWAAPRVGLDAPLTRALIERRPVGPILRRQAVPAIAVGTGTAVILAAYTWWTAPLFAAASKLPDLALPLVTKLLYGGLVEELMMRWGLMSLLVWLASLASRRATPGGSVYWLGIGGAALLFAAGHLPLLYLMLPAPPPGLIAAVILGNALPGALFGWLFWQRGLEAAVLAHALAHTLFTAGAAILR